jgi:hypothetical protein
MVWLRDGLMSCLLDASSRRPHCFQKEDAEKSSQIKNEDIKRDGLSGISKSEGNMYAFHLQKKKKKEICCKERIVWEMSDIANV